MPQRRKARKACSTWGGTQGVRTLASGDFAAGNHDATWNGRDDAGRALPSGVYLVRLRGGGVEAMQKVVLME